VCVCVCDVGLKNRERIVITISKGNLS
jgi:hypothetical protein